MQKSRLNFFTLPELLVILSLLALFGSLLVGQLGRLHHAAIDAKCADNLRKNHTAQAVYSAASDNWLVPARNAVQGGLSWVNILSGVNHHGIRFSEGYGLEFYGSIRNTGSQFCPAESVPFSKGFPVGHFGINTNLGTLEPYFIQTRQTRYGRKKLSAVTAPDQAVFAGDNGRRGNDHVNSPYFLSYRHGTDRPDHRTDPRQAPTTGGQAGLVYMDGHSASRTFDPKIEFGAGIDLNAGLPLGQ